MSLRAPLIILDTMVVISAVSGDPRASSAAVLDCVATGEARLAISDDQLSELVRVLAYPPVARRMKSPVRIFEVALDIGYMGIMRHPRRLDWPSLEDPKDAWLFDLAEDAGADWIISRDHGVKRAATRLGFEVATAARFLRELRGNS